MRLVVLINDLWNVLRRQVCLKSDRLEVASRTVCRKSSPCVHERFVLHMPGNREPDQQEGVPAGQQRPPLRNLGHQSDQKERLHHPRTSPLRRADTALVSLVLPHHDHQDHRCHQLQHSQSRHLRL